jgi:hypothetical protein
MKWAKIITIVFLAVINCIQLTDSGDAEDKYGKPDDNAKPKNTSIEAETKNRYR